MSVLPDIGCVVNTLYDGRCTVYERRKKRNPEQPNLVEGLEEVAVLENIPCRVSYGTQREGQVERTEVGAAMTQAVKLFLAPDVRIAEGSKLVVTQNGVTTAYRQSGPPSVYASHQEIGLELFKEWA